MIQLLDADGNPIRKEVLTRRQSEPMMGGIRSIRDGLDTAGIEPERMAQIFREANMGRTAAQYELAEQLEEKDAHYQSVLNTRKNAVVQLDFTVEAADASAEAEADAQFVRDFLARDELQGEVYDILDAIGKGVSFSEIIWDHSESQWDIAEIVDVPQKWFEFDLIDGRTPRLIGDNNERLDLDPYKYIVHYHKAKTGLPARGGLVRPCAWMWLFKNFSFKDWAVFADAYGQPIRIGKYDAGSSAADRDVLLQAVTSIGSDLGAIIPASMSIEFIRDQGATATVDLFERFIRIADEQISKAVLGQTSTTDAMQGGGIAGNESHNDVRGDICKSDAVKLGATLNKQLIQPYVRLNRGDRKKYPCVKIGRAERVDGTTESQVISTLVNAGARISQKKVLERLNIPMAESDDDVLRPPQAAAPAFMARQAWQTSLAAQSINEDAITQSADAQADDWQEIMNPILVAIDAAVEAATSREDLEQRLLQLSATLPVDGIAQKLAYAAFNARLAGNLGAKLK